VCIQTAKIMLLAVSCGATNDPLARAVAEHSTAPTTAQHSKLMASALLSETGYNGEQQVGPTQKTSVMLRGSCLPPTRHSAQHPLLTHLKTCA
jgi:hypothetical protein